MPIHQALITSIRNPFNIQVLGTASSLTTTDLSATFDCSTVATGDSVIFLYMGEDDGDAATGQTFSLSVGGSTANTLVSNSNTAGKARAGIFLTTSSSVVGNSSVRVSITSSNQNGGARGYIAALRVSSFTPGEDPTLRKTESSSSNLLQNSFNNQNGGNLILTVGYFSNGNNHTLSCDEADLITGDGVTTSAGSGDFGFMTAPATAFAIDYTRGGTANSQGDVLISISISPG